LVNRQALKLMLTMLKNADTTQPIGAPTALGINKILNVS